MISLIPTTDLYEIKTCLSRDKLYYNILGIKDLDSWEPNFTIQGWFLVVQENKEVGIFILTLFSTNCLCFHGGLFKEYRSASTPNMLQDCLDIVRSNDKVVFITTIPEKNINAIRVVEECGFKYKTTIKNGCESDNLLIYGEE